MKNDLTMFGYVIRLAAVLVAVTFLAGCGKSNDAGLQLSAVNKHPADWLTAHRSAYMKTPDVCRSCHGTDLNGGVTKIDCSNQVGLGQCHAGGHPPRQVAHPLPFKAPAVPAALHGSEAKKDLIICQDCHGEPNATTGESGAGSNPRFNKTIGSLPSGCELSGCHLINMAHPKPWKGHKEAGNTANACALCHGATFAGGSGPACTTCHTQLLAGIVPVAGQCTSCHGNPPNGTVTPNRAGSHAVHLALGGMSGNCAACHTGGGSVAANHGTVSHATVAFATTLNANLGAATYVAATGCVNVACHGGKQTPVWGGSLDSCTGCHQAGTQAGTPEYISYFSGKHDKHMNFSISGTGGVITCTDCHDMTSDSKHFKDVTTKAFETLPSTTLRSFYNATQQSCTITSPLPPGVQFTGCHSGTRSWN
jgi:predicted CxxxxCH...CXXCH cytochrome family protein